MIVLTKEGVMYVRVLRSSDIARCPAHRLDPGHYRDDGTCRCDEEA